VCGYSFTTREKWEVPFRILMYLNNQNTVQIIYSTTTDIINSQVRIKKTCTRIVVITEILLKCRRDFDVYRAQVVEICSENNNTQEAINKFN